MVNPDLACGCLIAHPGAARGAPACNEPAACIHQGVCEIKTGFKEGLQVLNPSEMTHQQQEKKKEKEKDQMALCENLSPFVARVNTRLPSPASHRL